MCNHATLVISALVGALFVSTSSAIPVDEIDSVGSGSTAELEGTVAEIKSTTTGSLMVSFEGSPFLAVVKQEAVEELTAALGGDPSEILTGNEAIVRGAVVRIDGVPMVQIKAADQLTTPALTQAAEVAEASASILPVTSYDEILAKKGEEVSVIGRVEDVFFVSGGGIGILNFEGTDFSAIVRRDDQEEIEKAIGGTLRDTLSGEAVQISGLVEIYNDDPQIRIKDASQLTLGGNADALLAAGPKSPIGELIKTDDEKAITDAHHSGEPITLLGEIDSAQENGTGSVFICKFKQGDIQAIIRSGNMEAVRAGLGVADNDEMGDELEGKLVWVIGEVSKYYDDLQIEIKGPENLVVDPPEQVDAP